MAPIDNTNAISFGTIPLIISPLAKRIILIDEEVLSCNWDKPPNLQTDKK